MKPRYPAPVALLAPGILLVIVLALFGRSLLSQEAFLPADLLQNIAPYQSDVSSQPAPTETKVPWNVLRFDGITQFYPWRLEAARQWRAGQIPLWNPYQFGAEGGTPLLANSQSAPLYPPNGIFALLPPGNVWYGFGLLAALHLFVAAFGVYALTRNIGLRLVPSLLSAVTFMLSGPVVTWLALPTFLAVSAWMPWLLLLIRIAAQQVGTRTGRLEGVGAGAVAGLLILAGHLQIAFYALLAGGLYAVWQLRFQATPMRRRWLVGVCAAGGLALSLAAAQVLPSVELSRVSHRAASGKSGLSWEMYQAYTRNALPVRNLVTWLVPDFFGHPNAGNYWNDSPIGNNYAEWCGYVGVLPLLLSLFALFSLWRDSSNNSSEESVGILRERGYFAVLLTLATLMVLGTPINLLFFFGVPGFAQTGNPGRALVLVAFALSILAGMGLELLIPPSVIPVPAPLRKTPDRAAGGAILLAGLVAAVGANSAVSFAAQVLPQVTFGELMAQAGGGIRLGGSLFVVGALMLFTAQRLPPRYRPALAWGVLAITATDLLGWGNGYNPTVSPDKVYPVTPGIAWLQTHGPNALIAPINRQWSLNSVPPHGAVLPPNGATVYRLHDLQGYDSLFYGSAKRRVRDAAQLNSGSGDNPDPSPPANGNMVFVKMVETSRILHARYILLPQNNTTAPPVGMRVAYQGADMVVWENPAGQDYQSPARPYAPASFRVGLFLGLTAIGTLITLLTHALVAGRIRRKPRSPAD